MTALALTTTPSLWSLTPALLLSTECYKLMQMDRQDFNYSTFVTAQETQAFLRTLKNHSPEINFVEEAILAAKNTSSTAPAFFQANTDEHIFDLSGDLRALRTDRSDVFVFLFTLANGTYEPAGILHGNIAVSQFEHTREPGRVAHIEISNYLRTLYAFPDKRGGAGHAIMEAHACSLYSLIDACHTFYRKSQATAPSFSLFIDADSHSPAGTASLNHLRHEVEHIIELQQGMYEDEPGAVWDISFELSFSE